MPSAPPMPRQWTLMQAINALTCVAVSLFYFSRFGTDLPLFATATAAFIAPAFIYGYLVSFHVWAFRSVLFSLGATYLNFFVIGGGWDFSPSGRFHAGLSLVAFVFGLLSMYLSMATMIYNRTNQDTYCLPLRIALWSTLAVAVFVSAADVGLSNTTAHYQFAQHAINHCIFAGCLGLHAVLIAAFQKMARLG